MKQKVDTMNKLLKSLLFSAGILVSATSVAADYPSKNIRLVVPFGAGGGTDAVGRTLANSAKDILGQNIAVMNRTGGAGAVGMSFGAQQRPTCCKNSHTDREMTRF